MKDLRHSIVYISYISIETYIHTSIFTAMMTFRLMKECFSNSNRHLRIASTDIRKHSFLKGVCTQDKTLDSVKLLVSYRKGRTFQEEWTIFYVLK